MPKNKVNYALIENESKRKLSYQKRRNSLLKKSEELQILCGVEVAVVISVPYRNEPAIFPNSDAVRNTFIKFSQLPTLDQSKYMVTPEKYINQRIKKLERELQKVRKENKVTKLTNEMYEVLSGKNVSVTMHPYDHNDLSCVVKKNLKEVRELMNKRIDEEGSGSNTPRPIVEPLVTERASSSVGTWDPSPLLFSQIFPPVVPQLFSSMPPQMTNIRELGMAPPMPSTIMNCLMSSPMMAPPIGVSMPMNNNQNNFNNLSDSPSLSGLFNWNNDEAVTLDDLFFRNINIQDPNNSNNS